MAATNESESPVEQANELYWGSDLSVNQIAEELDLSKGALYGMIRPLPAGSSCPECGEEVVSPNRTARDRDLVACPACGWEGEEDEAALHGREGGVTYDARDDDDVTDPAVFDRSRARVILGGALLGAAAGLAVVMWVRRGRS